MSTPPFDVGYCVARRRAITPSSPWASAIGVFGSRMAVSVRVSSAATDAASTGRAGAVVVLVLVGAPCGEHAAGELEALLAEGLLLGEAF